MYMAFSFLDPVLGPMLQLNPFWSILILSGVLSLVLTLIYKWTTDQNLMKQLKDEMSSIQKEIKELKNDPEKAMHAQKKAMESNMKYMMESLKPTLFTFIPIILIFGWLSGHYGYEPIKPGEEFLVTAHFSGPASGGMRLTLPEGLGYIGDRYATIAAGKGEWAINATQAGKYLLSFEYANKTYTKTVLVTEERGYEDPITKIGENSLVDINIQNKKLIVMNLFGWEIGWLGSYLIFSIIFSIVLRKVLNVY